MALPPGPGNLAVSGAGFLAQAPEVESPLPGGVATVVRFLFNLPAWIQIAGIVVGILVALAVAVALWRRRRAIAAWLSSRPRTTRIWLGATAAAVLLLTAGFGGVGWNYMQHDNGFCTGCHVMGPAYVRFTQSEHSKLSCHDCHQQSLFASMRQLYLWVAERPAEIGPHAKVPNAVCAKCHVTGEKEVWQRIASTAGHRTHLESREPALQGVQCVTCHGVEVHRFAPLDRTCGQAGCHDQSRIALGKMAGQTALHCTTCHRFTADLPALAGRDSALGALRPGAQQCFGCHEMRQRLAGMEMDPARDAHRGSCGMCHNPHRQESPAAARATCTQAGCHADWRTEPFHIGESHRRAAPQCITCHLPHQAQVDASDCAGCHRAVNERTGRRLPVPFDTTRALRPVSWGHGPAPGRAKGKGDAPLPDDPPPRLAPPDTFSHTRHQALSCITCHAIPQGGRRLTFERPRGCQICHHQRPEASNCGACHQAAQRAAARDVAVRVIVRGHAPRDRPVPFRHTTHEAPRCVVCHTTPVTLAVDPAVSCRSCHAEHHAAGRNCGACHGGADPRAAHAVLPETHVRCDRCHAPAVVSLLTPDRRFCETCHGSRERHYADRECTVCHFLASPQEFRTTLHQAGDG
ncbi:MAG TPA: multiheme c-type cytochrome [Gemmatimonadales bacterium]|nr:multiheme c-type cytochrome [Gemmatimonadales bacterium]